MLVYATETRINETLRERVNVRKLWLSCYSPGRAVETKELIGADANLPTQLRAEVELIKLGYSMTGHITKSLNANDYLRGDNRFKFNLTVYKNGKEIWSGEYSHGALVNPATRKIEYLTPREFRNKYYNSFRQPAPATPTVADVLYCLLNDAACGCMTHSEFCDEYGYNEDSRKNFELYLACQKTHDKIKPYMQELEPLFENY